MRKWNYRVVVRQAEDGEEEYGIYEVYYGDSDGPGEIEAWSESRIRPHGYTVEELRADLKLMGEALEKPVLNAVDLPGSWSVRPRL